MVDLAVIIISNNDARWLTPCLSSIFEHAGDVSLDVLVADNESTDGTQEVIEAGFPSVRIVHCPNYGFGHGNNRGLVTTDSRYVLFLNADTEILAGRLSDLVELMDARPDVGLLGVRQVAPDGRLLPTMRRFPSVSRALGEAVVGEKLPVSLSWMGERVLEMELYERESECDWTSGSFMLARREAVESGGFFDERLFVYSEEPDLCLRMKRAGWHVRHVPYMTILHHEGKAGINDRLIAQAAFARRQYAEKHFATGQRQLYLLAVSVGYALRSIRLPRDSQTARQRAAASRRALRALRAAGPPPFGPPPPTAVISRRLPEDAMPPATSASNDRPG